FNSNGKAVFSTDEFVPRLSNTDGKIKNYTEKKFYTDGNLEVLYLSQNINDFTVQIWIDIESDSTSKIVYSVMKIIPLFLIPILIFLFIFLLKITKKAFEREREFSANVSHELQTPVNAILGHANLLNRWGKSDEKQLETSINVIINEAHSMKAMITNLLQMTKLEKGIIKPQKTQIFVKEFFDSIKKEFKYEKNLEINFDKNISEEISIFTDKNLFHQIFIIAISNSVKFCPSPCKIELRFEESEKKAIFEIIDNGNGFQKETLSRVFDRFFKGDESHTREKGGAGLGLSIAKSIAIALNAKIKVFNEKTGGAAVQLEMSKYQEL
ncbi:MAG: HAMP domain-containing histidine kinase, partial [Treponema sp.]|nr:HAMP domain-containing histidine kinase [Candidatus Treponema equifaecale]